MFATIAVSFALGICAWSFAEYALHNWYGHVARGRNEFSREHLLHHARHLYFAPTSKKILTAASVMVVVAPLSILLAGLVAGIAFCAGFLVFYTTYEVLHRRAHTAAPRGPYGRWLRKHHFYHHFGNPKHNHGVTSPLWDVVFRTYARPGRVDVPRRLAMRWLTDPETGDVAAPFARDYALTGRGRRIEETARDLDDAYANAAPVA